MGNGDWVGIRGADGYWIPMFHPSLYAGVPLHAGAFTATIVQGSVYNWSDATDDDRALQDPNPVLQRCPQTVYHSDEVHVRLDFTADFHGVLSIYVLGWDQVRDSIISIDGADTTDTGAEQDGVWATWTISVANGESVDITAVPHAGYTNNVVFSGIFLDATIGPLEIDPGGIPSGEDVGHPTLVSHNLAPSSIPSGEGVGHPTLWSGAPILPGGIPSDEDVGVPWLLSAGSARFIYPEAWDDGEHIGEPSLVDAGPATIYPVGIPG